MNKNSENWIPLSSEIYSPTSQIDLLSVPFLGTLLRWRWGRLFFQIIFLLIALLVIYDGFTGPRLAPANNATVLVWVHFRGFAILALLLVGNVFCMGCPFTLTRTLAYRLSSSGKRWPAALRNKWLSFFTLALIFWLYEWFDLWSSPWLTAWVVIAFFLASFVLEALFEESPFCKYLCPLGAFNFVNAAVSPFQIHAQDAAICRTCQGKECLSGSETVLGCGTELFVPTIRSNFDCTFCLDCARACPYDNVGLSVRKPLVEITTHSLPIRWDYSILVVGLTIFAMLNAFGMVPPINALQSWMSNTLNIHTEGVRLSLIFGIGGFGAAALILFVCGSISSFFANQSAKALASQFSLAFIPLGFGIWFAHYAFHFSIGGLTIFPVLHSFLLDHGIGVFGETVNWDVGFLIPQNLNFPIQIFAVLVGFIAALYVLGRRGLKMGESATQGFLTILPWAVMLLILTSISLTIFGLPMEMRGAVQVGLQ